MEKNCFVSAFNEKSNKMFGVALTKTRSKENIERNKFYKKRNDEKGLFKPEYVTFRMDVIKTKDQKTQACAKKLLQKRDKHQTLISEQERKNKSDYLQAAQEEVEQRVSFLIFS